MSEDFLKPPSGGIWLAFVIALMFFGGQFLGPGLQTAAVWVAILCSGIALYVICRWLGRLAGWIAGEFVQGFHGGVEESKRRRAERAAS